MRYIIRAAESRDAAGLARVQVDSYKSAYAGLLPDDYLARFTYAEQEKDWRDLIAGDRDVILLVAAGDDSTIQAFALSRVGAATLEGYDSELRSLHVLPKLHRNGLGRQLVRATAVRLERAGCRSLMLWVLAENPARGFYERLGGEVIGERRIHLGENGMTVVEVAYGWQELRSLCYSRTLSAT